MEDKLLEKILNFVLNNMGNAECMHLESYINSRAKFYTDREKLVEALRFYADIDSWLEKPHEEGDWVWTYKTMVAFRDIDDRRVGGKLARTTLKELGEMEWN